MRFSTHPYNERLDDVNNSKMCISTPKSVVNGTTSEQNHRRSSTSGLETNHMAHYKAELFEKVSVWPYAKVFPGEMKRFTLPSVKTTSTTIPWISEPVTGETL